MCTGVFSFLTKLTTFLVKNDFELELNFALERFIDLSFVLVECVGPVEELACAAFLHDLCAGEPG